MNGINSFRPPTLNGLSPDQLNTVASLNQLKGFINLTSSGGGFTFNKQGTDTLILVTPFEKILDGSNNILKTTYDMRCSNLNVVDSLGADNATFNSILGTSIYGSYKGFIDQSQVNGLNIALTSLNNKTLNLDATGKYTGTITISQVSTLSKSLGDLNNRTQLLDLSGNYLGTINATIPQSLLDKTQNLTSLGKLDAKHLLYTEPQPQGSRGILMHPDSIAYVNLTVGTDVINDVQRIRVVYEPNKANFIPKWQYDYVYIDFRKGSKPLTTFENYIAGNQTKTVVTLNVYISSTDIVQVPLLITSMLSPYNETSTQKDYRCSIQVDVLNLFRPYVDLASVPLNSYDVNICYFAVENSQFKLIPVPGQNGVVYLKTPTIVEPLFIGYRQTTTGQAPQRLASGNPAQEDTIVHTEVDANGMPVRRQLLSYNYTTSQYEDPFTKKADLGHTHAISDITNLQSELNTRITQTTADARYSLLTHNHNSQYASITHTHAIGDVTGLQAALDSKLSSTHNHDISYAPISHTHTIAQITNLQSTLDGKANSTHNHDVSYASISHTHTIAQITNLQTTLDGKASSTHNHDVSYASISHTHTIAQITNLQTTLDGKASSTHNHDISYAPISHTHDYNTLTNKPTIPAPQIQSDWNQTTTTALDFIKNKPTITPQLQSDWNQTTTTALDFIKNKPTITPQIQSDWNQTTTTALDFIKNKPTIPAAQIQSDWNQTLTTAIDFIKNKPTITPQIQSDWNQTTTTALDFIKNKPTLPAAQIQSDWNQTTTTALDFIKNKPTIPAAATWTNLGGTQSSISLSNFGGQVSSLQTNIAYADDTTPMTGPVGTMWFNTSQLALKVLHPGGIARAYQPINIVMQAMPSLSYKISTISIFPFETYIELNGGHENPFPDPLTRYTLYYLHNVARQRGLPTWFTPIVTIFGDRSIIPHSGSAIAVTQIVAYESATSATTNGFKDLLTLKIYPTYMFRSGFLYQDGMYCLIKHNGQSAIDNAFMLTVLSDATKRVPFQLNPPPAPSVDFGVPVIGVVVPMSVSISDGDVVIRMLSQAGSTVTPISMNGGVPTPVNGSISQQTMEISGVTYNSYRTTLSSSVNAIQVTSNGITQIIPIATFSHMFSSFERAIMTRFNDYSRGAVCGKLVDVNNRVTYIPNDANSGVMLYMVWYDFPQYTDVQNNFLPGVPRYLFAINGTTPTARFSQVFSSSTGSWVNLGIPVLPVIAFKYVSFPSYDTCELLPYRYGELMNEIWGSLDYSTDPVLPNITRIFSYYGNGFTKDLFVLFQISVCYMKYGHVAVSTVSNSFLTKQGTDVDATTANSLHKWWLDNVYNNPVKLGMLTANFNTRIDGSKVLSGFRYSAFFAYATNPFDPVITNAEFEKLRVQIYG